MKKPENLLGVQMNLSSKAEWTNQIPILEGVAVSYANSERVGEYETGEEEKKSLENELLREVVNLSNLSKACQRVVSNKGSAGVDGMKVEDLPDWLNANWRSLQASILSGSYQVGSIRAVEIPKPKGGTRLLGIPTVIDRLIQQAIAQVLQPIYDPLFSPSSYGFRPGRSAQDAIFQLSHYLDKGKTYIVDIDMARFFDEVNHDRLLSRLSKGLSDKGLLRLIHQYLGAGILQGGLVHQRTKGTPQGSPLSPLLSNIVLDELDKELSQRGHIYVRYADDIVILVGSQKSADRVKNSISNFIETRLKLKVNAHKSRICRPLDLNYLGYSFLWNGQAILSQESETRLKNKVRMITRRNRGKSLVSIVKELNQVLRGWLNYFREAQMKGRLRRLDSWIRKRLRCYRLKQCKRAKGIHRFLKKLGVPENRCWTTAASRRGWWIKSSTPASNEGMNNSWFNQIGLFSLLSNYSSI